YYNQALPIYRSINDREDEAVTINNIGLIYHKKSNDVQKAMEYYNQALAIWSTLPGRLGEASTLNNIGTLHHDKGEYQQALDYYNQSLIIRRKLGDRSSEIIPLNQIGNTYEALGEKEKAFEKYNQALDIAKAEGNRFVEATLLNNLGSAYAQKDDNQKALDYYNRALLLKRSTGDKYGEAQVLHNIAKTYDSLNERQKSLDHYNQALAIWRAISNRFGESSTLSLLGDLYSRAGDKQQARDYLNQALTLKRAIGDRKGETVTLHYLARALRDSGDLAAAQIHIEAALKIIESLRANIGNREFRASYFASVRNYYDFYIDLLMRLDERAPAEGHAAEALRASEGARARNLLEMLAEARGNISRGIDPALAERQRTLERQLNIKTELQIRLLNDQHTDERDNALNKEIESLLAQYQEVETQIRMKSPHYADLALPQPLSLSQIQQQVLDSDTLLLEYALGDERSYLWAVTKTSITGHALPRRAEIESAARRFYELLNEPNQQLKAVDVKKKERAVRTATQSRDIEEAASALSRMLIEPVAEQLGKKRLLIVSEGALQYIPFTALAALQTKSSEFRPLILDHEIVNLPSASTLAVIRRETGGRKPAAKSVVVLADPVFDSQDERVKKAEPKPDGRKKKDGAKIDDRTLKVKVEKPVIETAAVEAGVTDSRLQIPRLPGTRTEAKKILELASSSERAHALDFQASRAAATDPSLNQYRYIHFATHGFLNSVHPELSGIVLSLVDERGARQEGFLLANEFYNLKLPAELVVLSACQSGLGKEIKGEGVVGLTRGLMYAGAARVIVSLWSVDDEATSELMVNLYKGILKKGMRPAEALRAAQIKMWEQTKWQAPYYWAAFVLQGEWK
ncbi:MAG TPA: CHAT domain-containing tetratricopeptide repeat protein, partial [Blastocatellia bacterium]|nr:CHAT domain-containing tetratricopeptide repeat protein [Blastocatellia bacterium]